MKAKITRSIFFQKDFAIKIVNEIPSKYFLLAILCALFSFNGFAQYTNYNNGRNFVVVQTPSAADPEDESDVAGFAAFSHKAKNAKSQYLYTYQEAKGNFAIDSDTITRLSFYIADFSGANPKAFSNVTIRMGYTDATAWPTGSGTTASNLQRIAPFDATQLVEVFSGPYTINPIPQGEPGNWIDFNLSHEFPLKTGSTERSIIVEVSYSYTGPNFSISNQLKLSCSQIEVTDYSTLSQARGCYSNTVPGPAGKDLYSTTSAPNSTPVTNGGVSRTQRPWIKFTYKATPFNTEQITYKTVSSRCIGEPVVITPVIYGTGITKFRWMRSNALLAGFTRISEEFSPTPELIIDQPGDETYYQLEAKIGTATFLTSFNSTYATLKGVKAYTEVNGVKQWEDNGWDNGNIPVAGESAYFKVTPTEWPFATDVVDLCSVGVAPAKEFKVLSGKTLRIAKAIKEEDIQGELIFENNSSLLQTSIVQNTAENVTYKRITAPMLRFDYTYYSSPVTGMPLINVSPGTLLDKFYSFRNNEWFQEDASGLMQPGEGYIIRAPQSFEVVGTKVPFAVGFSGKPNNGPIESTISPVAEHYNLVGNPYPSAVDILPFVQANTFLDGSIYLWDHITAPSPLYPGATTFAYNNNDYVAKNVLGTPNGPDDFYVAAGQSFMIKTAVAGSPIANWTNNMRVGSTNVDFHKVQNDKNATHQIVSEESISTGTSTQSAGRFWLDLHANNGSVKRLLVGYINGATDGIDRLYDAAPMDVGTSAFYALGSNNEPLSIIGKGLPFDDEQIIPLGFATAVSGNHTISKFLEDGFMSNYVVYLNDRLTNTLHNLSEASYTFATATGTFNDRFIIAFKPKTVKSINVDVRANKVVVFDKLEAVQLHSGQELMSQVIVYDLSGRIIAMASSCNSTEVALANLPRKNQLLVLEIHLENGTIETQKFRF